MSVPQDGRDLETQRQEFMTRVKVALREAEDPLDAYVQFVQWIQKNYADDDPNAGLAQVLKQATTAFKNDATYKTDLRYLKLWALYARQLDLPTAINMYAAIAKLQIGVSYSLLYEEYAKALERVGRIGDAEQIYRTGIKRQVRPLERLKNNYNSFKTRTAARAVPIASSASASTSPPSTRAPTSPPSASSAASRYATMLASPAPGKRPEKLRYDTSLLWTADGVEYCAAEARARTMGLLGKKWTALPTGILSPAAPRIAGATARVVFDDDEDDDTPKALRTMNLAGRRKSLMVGEPTVTINTKEALADVFGMYNSPEKTMKHAKPGSKYAPVKKIEAIMTPKQPHVQPPSSENQGLSRSQNSSFRPSVDENQPGPKATPKFVPFVDSEPSKTPLAPRSLTFAPPVTPANSALLSERTSENVFSRVFTPVAAKTPHRDVFTEAHGKPQAKPLLHERAKSVQDISSTTLEENQKTPFKVFSRPDSENAYTPKSAYTPSAKATFTPFRDQAPLAPLPVAPPPPPPPEVPHASFSADSTPSPSEFGTDESEPSPSPEDEDDYGSSFVEDEYEQPINDHDYETPPEENDGYAEYEDEGGYSEVPLGGRFGQFNVMTPITERTLEYTSTRSVFATPGDRPGSRPDDIEEGEDEDKYMLDQDGMDGVEEDWHPNASGEPWKHISQVEDDETQSTRDLSTLQESTGQLSLANVLTLSSNFRPANPCNPFDPSVLSTLLSLTPSDDQYYDLGHADANLLDGLQKFAKKMRKTSGGSNHGDTGSSFPLTLDGRKYLVFDKLGEGGFGAVFHAQSVGDRDEDDTEFDFADDDDEATEMVALKVVRPRNLWEYHVLRKLHSVLPAPLRRSVIIPHALFAFHDESFLVMEYCAQGTLLSVVTKAVSAGVSQQGACLDELLVFFFAIEIIRLLEQMHGAGFIHGDLKIDNCLLRLEDVPGGGSAWDGMYDPAGGKGWSCKGVKLIDFGRTINTRLFPPGQRFMADWPSDERDCVEIREERPWTYQTDYFGLAGVVYCLLFGKYIQTSSIALAGGRYKIATPFKRYWQTEIWTELFDLLLNPCLVRDGDLPVTAELSVMRKRMEAWLQANCNRTGGTLKGLLKKVEVSCLR